MHHALALRPVHATTRTIMMRLITVLGATCRLTGRAAYCRKLLSEEGILIEAPAHIIQGSEELQGEFFRPRLRAAAGGNLNAYRK